MRRCISPGPKAVCRPRWTSGAARSSGSHRSGYVAAAAVQALDGYTRGRRGPRPRRADTFHRPLGIALCTFGCVLLADLNDARHLRILARRAGQSSVRP